jgi:thiol:disulfide interchange protein DsbD
MALGMGVPLLAIGASAGALLPRAGAWMEHVKRAFGIMLVGLAIYTVSPVLPPWLHLILWAALLIVSAVYLRTLEPVPTGAPGYRWLVKGLGVLVILAGVAQLVGALSGGDDVLRPLAGLRAGTPPHGEKTAFQRVGSNAELDAALASANGRPVLLDFYADWCVSCKEMERDTFSSREVRARFVQMVTLQADVTANTADQQALLKRFGLFGPPGIVFFDRKGREIKDVRVIGYMAPDRFTAILDEVLR